MTVQSVAGKAVNALGHVVLAWLLIEEDFGLVSKAYAAVALPALFQQVGVREALLRRQRTLRRWVGAGVWMSLAFGVLSAVAMVAIAPFAATFFYNGGSTDSADASRARTLVWMIVALATAAPINTLANVPLAMLQARLRFRLVSAVGFGAVVSHTLLNVALAALDLGPYSFVLPWPIVGAMRLAVLWIASRPRVGAPRRLLRRWPMLIGDSGLVLAARAFAACVLVGDYVVLGRWHNDDVAGVYYLAFNLSVQTAILLATNMDGVLMPILARLQTDPPRQRDAFLRVARGWALLAVPLCFLQAALADPVVRLLLAPRWHATIPVLQVLSVGMAFRSLALPAQTLIAAQGRFRALMWLSAAGAVVFLALVTPAAASSPARSAAIVVAVAASIYFALEAPLMLYSAVRPAAGGWRDVGAVLVAPVALGAAAAMVGTVAGNLIPGSSAALLLVRCVLTTLVAAAVYVPAAWWLTPTAFAELSGRPKIFSPRRRG